MDSPSQPNPAATNNAPMKTDAEIQAAAALERQQARNRRGRRSTVLTSGSEPSAPTTAGSITPPGQATRLGAA